MLTAAVTPTNQAAALPPRCASKGKIGIGNARNNSTILKRTYGNGFAQNQPKPQIQRESAPLQLELAHNLTLNHSNSRVNIAQHMKNEQKQSEQQVNDQYTLEQSIGSHQGVSMTLQRTAEFQTPALEETLGANKGVHRRSSKNFNSTQMIASTYCFTKNEFEALADGNKGSLPFKPVSKGHYYQKSFNSSLIGANNPKDQLIDIKFGNSQSSATNFSQIPQNNLETAPSSSRQLVGQISSAHIDQDESTQHLLYGQHAASSSIYETPRKTGGFPTQSFLNEEQSPPAGQKSKYVQSPQFLSEALNTQSSQSQLNSPPGVKNPINGKQYETMKKVYQFKPVAASSIRRPQQVSNNYQ
ncbi:hypothetical protein FGO68_gene5079 [Halteria grandinella]|uniref:Uncharacterized protein n=1 Tax=Halteria grandinella TaxID=5974 RepID=A0A8J8N9Q7_HALGN|nr:hypothetical protein FGO68_gene5079 [Halteria grandinella]